MYLHHLCAAHFHRIPPLAARASSLSYALRAACARDAKTERGLASAGAAAAADAHRLSAGALKRTVVQDILEADIVGLDEMLNSDAAGLSTDTKLAAAESESYGCSRRSCR